ncbi:MAG: polymerase, sigma-24 subunit, subfamily, partial [Verrucomicrobiales bacterium]|nr:polymerase, sigma-24 subunit, subfamily [Verrucomicrobiales bacterium]
RDTHIAEEVTQAVFIILAQKAARISDNAHLTGWLFQTTRFAAIAEIRASARRQQQTEDFQMQAELQQPASDPVWEQMAPLLDEALSTLGEKDRQAVLLRFFENKSLAEVGTYLKTNQNTAGRRVTRALEKLRQSFLKRGVATTTIVIGTAISAHSVHAAPITLTTSISAAAMTQGTAALGSTLPIVKGALKLMAWTKIKLAVVVGAGLLLATGTTIVTVKQIQEHRTYPWQTNPLRIDVLDQVPPQVRIVPTKFPKPGSEGLTKADGRTLGIGYSAEQLIEFVYYGNPFRTIISTKLPEGRYDFISNFPSGSKEALQLAAKKKFGVVGRHEMRETDVLLLNVKRSGAQGLKLTDASTEKSSARTGAGIYLSRNRPISWLEGFLENYLEVPVIDRTGLIGNFDIEIKWDAPDWKHRNPDALKRALLDQLGLELVPSREPIDMLIVERVKN